MDTSIPAAAAPAQPTPTADTTAPTVTTAADSAVASNDVAAYRDARRLERAESTDAPARAPREPGRKADTGGPAAGPEAAAATPDQRAVSKRQQQINDYERNLAELRAENARLRGGPPPEARPGPTPSPATPSPAKAPVIDIRQPALEEASFYTKHPDASTADYVRYLNRYDREVEQATEHLRAAQTAAQTAAHERATKFHEQITAAGDPAVIIGRLDPTLVELETRAYAQAQGKPISAANDLADEIIDSDVALQVLEHLTAHPDVKAKLLAAPNRRALVREFSRLEAQFTPAPGTGTAPKTITDAPAPAVTLGSRAAQMGDPVESAVARGDVAGYREARRAQRAAQLR